MYYGTPPIVTDGLILNLDAANTLSYVSGSTTWNDLSGNNYSGSLENNPTFDNLNGGSIVFDGTDDYVSLTQSTNNLNFSCEVFLKPTNISKDQMYVGITIAATYIRFSNSRAFLSVRTTTAQRTLTHSSTLANNQIYHIVSIYNGVQLKIYVNGVLTQGTVLNEPLLVPWGIDRIGRWRDGDQRSFVGNIYTLRLYNRELSAQEITQNYNAIKGRFGLQ
jgi:hypothetical protein